MKLEFNITGTKGAAIKLSQKIKLKRRTMKKAAIRARRDVTKHFKKSKGPRSQWTPLTETTLELREHGGHRPLRDTGHLSQSLRIKANKKTSRVYTRVKYAGFHNNPPAWKKIMFGKNEVKVPRRQFMWLSSRAKKDIKRIMLGK